MTTTRIRETERNEELNLEDVCDSLEKVKNNLKGIVVKKTGSDIFQDSGINALIHTLKQNIEDKKSGSIMWEIYKKYPKKRFGHNYPHEKISIDNNYIYVGHYDGFATFPISKPIKSLNNCEIKSWGALDYDAYITTHSYKRFYKKAPPNSNFEILSENVYEEPENSESHQEFVCGRNTASTQTQNYIVALEFERKKIFYFNTQTCTVEEFEIDKSMLTNFEFLRPLYDDKVLISRGNDLSIILDIKTKTILTCNFFKKIEEINISENRKRSKIKITPMNFSDNIILELEHNNYGIREANLIINSSNKIKINILEIMNELLNYKKESPYIYLLKNGDFFICGTSTGRGSSNRYEKTEYIGFIKFKKSNLDDCEVKFQELSSRSFIEEYEPRYGVITEPSKQMGNYVAVYGSGDTIRIIKL